jgi:hypothetical protein
VRISGVGCRVSGVGFSCEVLGGSGSSVEGCGLSVSKHQIMLTTRASTSKITLMARY